MKRVLLVGWGAIGDAVHAIPALIALRRSLGPGAEIHFQSVLARREGVTRHETVASDLLEPLGLTDRVRHLEVPQGRLGIAFIEARVLGALLGGRFDRVIVAMPFASPPRLLALLARWPTLICLDAVSPNGGAPANDRPLSWRLLESLRRHGLVSATGDDASRPFLNPPATGVEEARAWLGQHRLRPAQRLVAIAPDASYPANRWPADRFATLARRIEALGGFEVVLCGGGGSAALCREIAVRCPGILVSAGQLSIYGTAALLQRASLFIGLDTGTTHLASACGVPFVALYGQRGSGRWYFPPCPVGVVLQEPVPCHGCWLSRCDRPGHPCLNGIGVDRVVAAALETLEKAESA